MTNQTNTSDFCQNHPFFVNLRKSFESKKNLLSSTVILYIKKACQVWGESFKRFSSNRGQRFKKLAFEENAFKVVYLQKLDLRQK